MRCSRNYEASAPARSKVHPPPFSAVQDVVAESVATPLEGASDETAPVATAVESVEAGSTAAVVSGEGKGGSSAPADDAASPGEASAPEEEKPAPSEKEEVVPEAKPAASGDAKPAEPAAAAAATEDASNGNGNGTAVESNGDAAAKEEEENGEIKQDPAAAAEAAAAAAVGGNAGEVKEKAGEEGMEVEAPPKEDLIVDYTDEFGRVRQMLQR